ncbi:hypothetical protein MMC31_000317 [Peltigera leucophlebia]|nr:hypothetical protein [Peltigera leucophlebia]
MHTSFPILLAVSFNLAAAGLIRRSPYDRNFVRSYNQSSVVVAPVDQGRDSASRSSTSIISVSSVRAQLSPVVQPAPISSASPSKQVGSVPAVGDGFGAASIQSKATTTVLAAESSPTSGLPASPASLAPSRTVAPTFPARSSQVVDNATASDTSTKQAGSVPAIGSGPGAASVVTSAGTISLIKDSAATSQPSFATSAGSLPAETAVLANVGEAQTSTVATKQVGSVPALGSGPDAASVGDEILTHKVASSVTRIASVAVGIRSGNISEIKTTAATRSVSSFTSSPVQTLSSSLIETRSPRGPSNSRAVTPSVEPTGAATVLPSTNATRLSISTKSSASSSGSSTLQPSSIQPPIPRITEFSDTQGNVEAAVQFNQFFSSLGPNSQCSAEINTQAVVCINKQIAICGSNFRYALQPCPEGQSCTAVPLDNGSKGISIQCIVPKDVTPKLSPGQPSSRSSASFTSLSSLVSVTQNATTQGTPSTSVTQESVKPSSQDSKTSSKPQATTTVSAESGSSLASQTNGPSPVRSASIPSPIPTPPTSALPIATPSASEIPSAAKATETPNIASTPITLITRASESLLPASGSATPISEVPAAFSEQVPESETLSPSKAIENQPTLAVVPEKRRTSFLSTPEPTSSSVALSIVIKPAAPVITSSPKVAASADVVTVTVTTTVHDKA